MSDRPVLGQREFRALRDIIFREVGIRLDDLKHALVETRISRRLRDLNLPTYAAYVAYLENEVGGAEERQSLINAITTNKTDFFREAHHFELLKRHLLPEIREKIATGAPRPIRIWSAGCSSGEEPYTLAITALEAGFDRSTLRIVATDVDTDVLQRASRAVYTDERLQDLDPNVRNRWFLRGRGSDQGTWKVKKEVCELIEFRQVNLIKPPWPLDGLFDIVFCRNVIIYFDRPTQRVLFEGFAERLRQDGALFIGHSENLMGVSDRFETIEGTAYRCTVGTRSAHEVHAEPVAPAPLPTHRIVVGDVFASREPAMVGTILGSCIAACLYDEEAGVGGMNHFLLPETHHDDGPLTTRYGVHAMERLINELLSIGARRARLKAKVFGASTVGNFKTDVQANNARFIRTFLEKEGIPVLGERLLGQAALDVRFRTDTGQAFVRTVSKASRELAQNEARAQKSFVAPVAVGGDVDLF